MTKPRTKKMLLVAVATLTAPGAIACSSNTFATGFSGDIAYDGGYDDSPGFGDGPLTTFPDGGVDGESTDAADAADAADDADDAGDTGDTEG